ncbi:alkylation response protein AidB-like acyl-CoA dehydrogenase [Microbacterium marinum]|uniref:Dibenzothiophene monooxygenase n=1 Tax=Microbacterium marinum TaxID=421115 RepID=A0A7W7BN44_9MICO|nr:acyl-CoA dehydrogenase family protein [Microbacterium marinum]MBB4665702.1 alkylation response protein AidB-like acyl-CoA dehydrogenase [Microbacterium marinum]
MPTTTATRAGATTAELLAHFRPVLDRIAAGALERESDRRRPHDAVGWLKKARFGAVRLPHEEGGFGATIEQEHTLLIELGAADSNLPQIWRNHFAFVEDVLFDDEDGRNEQWRDEIATGALFGGAWSEAGSRSFFDMRTALTRTVDGPVLNRQKFYSTGSLFADWISVLAAGPDADQVSLVLVEADAAGVTLVDDWDGIGQRLTGSGTTTFDEVAVPVGRWYPFAQRARYQEAVYQLNHLATLAGISRAAQRDLTDAVRSRLRNYPQGLADAPREDAQIQEVVGRVSALASSAEASVLWAARVLDDAVVTLAEDLASQEPAVVEGLRAATIAVYEAQLTVTEAALAASTLLFDALSSSALAESRALDRHWRNARTVASHNPRVYRARVIGDWHLNGADPSAAFAP